MGIYSPGVGDGVLGSMDRKSLRGKREGDSDENDLTGFLLQADQVVRLHLRESEE